MRLYGYNSNLVSASGTTIYIVAENKKEALKFAKPYKGLVVGAKIPKYGRECFSAQTMMEEQKRLLDNALAKGDVLIKEDK